MNNKVIKHKICIQKLFIKRIIGLTSKATEILFLVLRILFFKNTGLDDKSERFSWFFDDNMKNMQPIFIKIDT